MSRNLWRLGRSDGFRKLFRAAFIMLSRQSSRRSHIPFESAVQTIHNSFDFPASYQLSYRFGIDSFGIRTLGGKERAAHCATVHIRCYASRPIAVLDDRFNDNGGTSPPEGGSSPAFLKPRV